MTGPLQRYRNLVEDGAIDPDPSQDAAAVRLQALENALTAPRRLSCRLFLSAAPKPKGVYLFGGVGRGKSMLMDIFFNNSDFRPKRRVHFHEFMAEIHERVAAFRARSEREKRRHRGASKTSLDDPMPPVAFDVAREAKLLCFDEFHVTDIADAMILGRLFEALFREGVVIVATSNRRPDDLYTDGLNRRLFLPFIDLLNRKLDVMEIETGKDFRLARLKAAPVYYAPLGPGAERAMDAAWERVTSGARPKSETLAVKGRAIDVPRAARGAARFPFAALCEEALGASDYLALARRYSTLFIDHVPVMGPEERDQARRFSTLIDALYEFRVKLVCSAAAQSHELYQDGPGAFEFQRTASRLIEMRSESYLAAEHAVAAAPPF
jgi:cell division protein ZapE